MKDYFFVEYLTQCQRENVKRLIMTSKKYTFIRYRHTHEKIENNLMSSLQVKIMTQLNIMMRAFIT